jgi:nitronate monooxygenase
VWGNYLKPSIAKAGMDPDNLERSDPTTMNFAENREKPKSWKEIWGSGQGIGAVKSVVSVEERVAQMAAEFDAAKARLARQLEAIRPWA